MSRIAGIRQDEEEYINIIKGKIRRDLSKYIMKARFIVDRSGKNIVAIPVSEIDVPTLRFGFPEEFVIGQGDGDVGDDLGPVDGQCEDGEKGAGDTGGGDSEITIEVEEEEFLKWFQELLELPNIQPKGDRVIIEEKEKFTSIHHIGPKSSIHLRKSFKEALKRSVATGEYKPPEQVKTIVITPPDTRYKVSEKVLEPRNNAVLAFMRDVSGSLSDDEMETLSALCDYCERWIRASYRKYAGAIETFYIIHDAEAREVGRQQFLATQTMGGTIASSAHEVFLKIIEERFTPTKWNIYCFYFSDGVNFDSDNEKLLELLSEEILPIVNQYNYGQTEISRPWWDAYSESKASTFSRPGTIGQLLKDNFQDADNLAIAVVTGEDEESIIAAIKEFFKKKNQD